ncbi:hypothetical protein LMG29542_07467 [Paraburkholderia humisilvae]|uniref:Uncharacterized protein n=1 Tax=Paraburkholderia humisilvae TaxID=627669 RepID=A0A6J5F8N4_9BURK|nr:hypothetical protein LMG29542_07467 [Paraburkholderia humisilvae]
MDGAHLDTMDAWLGGVNLCVMDVALRRVDSVLCLLGLAYGLPQKGQFSVPLLTATLAKPAHEDTCCRAHSPCLARASVIQDTLAVKGGRPASTGTCDPLLFNEEYI